MVFLSTSHQLPSIAKIKLFAKPGKVKGLEIIALPK
jgi:hypothetical protein